MLYFVFFLVLQFSRLGIERVSCFTFIGILMSCNCYCSLPLPHDVMGWSAKKEIIFPRLPDNNNNNNNNKK